MHSFRKKRQIGKYYETRDLGQRKNKKRGSARCGMWVKGRWKSKSQSVQLWVKQGGKWRLAAHQTTKLADY